MLLTISLALQSRKRKTLGNFSAYFSKYEQFKPPKSAAAKNIDIDIDIDITDILESEISVNIDIGKGDIDPALVATRIPHYCCWRMERLLTS